MKEPQEFPEWGTLNNQLARLDYEPKNEKVSLKVGKGIAWVLLGLNAILIVVTLVCIGIRFVKGF